MIKNKKHLFWLSVAGVLAVISWIIAIYYWGKLPAVIPTHFGFNGQADAWNNKSMFYVFLIPVLQTIFFGLFVFLYVKPQYSDMPTTLFLMAMDEKKREHSFSLIRTMIMVVSVWIGVLFSYMTFVMNASALNPKYAPNPWVLLGLIGSLLIWLGFWTVKVYKVTNGLIEENKK